MGDKSAFPKGVAARDVPAPFGFTDAVVGGDPTYDGLLREIVRLTMALSDAEAKAAALAAMKPDFTSNSLFDAEILAVVYLTNIPSPPYQIQGMGQTRFQYETDNLDIYQNQFRENLFKRLAR